MKLHFIAIEFIVILQHEIIFSNETSECIIPHDILGHGGLPHVNKYKSCYLSSLVDLDKGFIPFNALLMGFKLMTIFFAAVFRQFKIASESKLKRGYFQ